MPHVPFALLRVHVSYVCTIRRTYKWFTDGSGTIWLKNRFPAAVSESACGERVRDTAIIHVFVGVNIRVLDWCPPQSVTGPKGTTHVCPD